MEPDTAPLSGSAGQEDDDSCGMYALGFSAISARPCVALYKPHNCLYSSLFSFFIFLYFHMLVTYTTAGVD